MRAQTDRAQVKDAVRDPYAWRLPQPVISLENFDFPELHRRSEFDADKIGGIAAPLMAGCAVKCSPEQVRNVIHSGEFDRASRVHLNELIMQFDCYDIRRFTMYCGISLYEMARSMLASSIAF